MLTRFVLVVFMSVAVVGQGRTLQPDAPKVCGSCAEWNQPREPYRIFGNTYYVGVAGLSAVLVVSDAGLVLLDGALPQSAELIDRNIRKLGFRTEDIRLILNSHAHYDHSGGIAALQRLSGASVAASPSGARAMRQGMPTDDDPQIAIGRAENAFPAVANVREVSDGEVLRVGNVAITTHHTPGHTPGSTTWSWRSCEGERCVNVVYADSLNPVSASSFRFTGGNGAPSVVETFRKSIARVEALPCDVLVSVHPGFSNLDRKLAARAKQTEPNPFIDPGGCRAYAASARASLERRVAQEQ